MRIAEIRALDDSDTLGRQIAKLHDRGYNERRKKTDQIKELRNYLFAVDTSTTSNATLPWKNKTTRPALTQIRDVLHANYLNALFPNDRWLRWEAYTQNDAELKKRKAIEAYMDNKLREGGFISTVSELIYDYIDTGNAFCDTEWCQEEYKDPQTGEMIPGFIGPKLKRLSMYDQVFDPTGDNYEDSWKITRYLKSIGQLKYEIETRPELAKVNKAALDKVYNIRQVTSSWRNSDVDKMEGYQVDGFGSISDYFQSGYVEILQFEGSINDTYNDKFLKDIEIWVADRSYVIYQEPMKTWNGKSTKNHCAWRSRPDNAYGMGPLDNLVGLQYRIDHLENLKADAMDLAVFPPLGIKGDADEVDWAPNAQNFLGETGEIVELGKNLSGVIAAQNEIDILMKEMQDMAGAPKEAAGIRTPGEKTMFEVQSLENARGRIFQNSISKFEREIIEPALNHMLEQAKRNMNVQDTIRVMDDDNGVLEFLDITKEDLVAKGKLRPIGSRHYAANAQLVQNIVNLFNSGLMQQDAFTNHWSFKNLAKTMESVMGLERFQLYKENAKIFEMAETQSMMSGAAQELEVQDITPTQEEMV